MRSSKLAVAALCLVVTACIPTQTGGTAGGAGGGSAGGTGGAGGGTAGGTGGGTAGGTGGGTAGGTGGTGGGTAGGTGGGTGGGTAGGTGGGTAGGTGGGTAGGTGGTGGGTAGGSGGGTAGGSGGGSAGYAPRLYVARGNTLLFWNNAHQIAAARPADGQLPVGAATIVAMATANRQLFAGGSTSVARWDDALTVDAGTLANGAFLPLPIGAGPRARRMFTAPSATGGVDLWYAGQTDIVARLAAERFTDAGAPEAFFNDGPNAQLYGAAYCPGNGTLYVARAAGAGAIIAWRDAGTVIGDGGVPSYTLRPGATQQLAYGSNRIYSHAFTSQIDIWDDCTTIGNTLPPSVTMDAGSGLTTIRDMLIQGTTLVVTTSAGGSATQVLLYANAPGITGNVQPTQRITDAGLSGSVSRGVLGTDGTLYVADDNSVSIYGSALTNPTFKAELAIGTGVTELVLVE